MKVRFLTLLVLSFLILGAFSHKAALDEEDLPDSQDQPKVETQKEEAVIPSVPNDEFVPKNASFSYCMMID